MRKNTVDYVLLCVGVGIAVLNVVVFFAIALYAGPRPHAAVPQSDTLLYQQYARSIAEGHPYQFIPGDPPSTGSTSHLYPWVLSVLYLGGSRGDALATAGFAFHAACYVIFLGLFWLVAKRLTAPSAWLAFLLCVFSGHTIFTFLGQTDMGLFMVLSMAALAAAVYQYYVALGVLLFLSALCRPEGVILSGVLAVVGLVRLITVRQRRTGPLVASGMGLAAFAIVLLLNKGLTGMWQFQSVASKGYFKIYPFFAALRFVTEDVATLAREVVLGLGKDGRQFYVVPVVGGLLALIGIFSRDWRRGTTRHAEAWWLLSCVAALALISLSDWQGFLQDRYLGWILPVWLIYVSRGAFWITRGWRWTWGRGVLWVLLLCYQVAGLAYFGTVYARRCERTTSNAAFAREVHAMLPADAGVGLISNAGLAYYMPGRTIRNLSGIVSPVFSGQRHFFSRIEWLKHHEEDRFEAWLLPVRHAGSTWVEPFLGRRMGSEMAVAADDETLVLHAAKWGTFEAALEPGSAEALKAIAGRELVDRLDVGFDEDETRCGYSKYDRIGGIRLHPFVSTRLVDGKAQTDVGEVVLGAETFRVAVRPRESLRIVVRTAQSATATLFRDSREMLMETFTFSSPLVLRVLVNGQLAGDARIDVSSAADVFREVVLDVPGNLITGEEVEITVGGDHVSFGYWFYQ